MRPGYETIDALIGAAKRLLFALRWEELEQKYRPDQPRVPAGSSGGGRWTSGAGGAAIAATPETALEGAGGLLQEIANRPPPPRGPVSLTREEAEGGHAVRDHVGKSNGDLVRTLQVEDFDGPLFRVYGYQEGSFNDLASADKYVNDVLSSSSNHVDDVASGRRSDEFLRKRYSSPTGREAYRLRSDPKGVIRLRPTFWVAVHIVHVGHGKGFSVRTAYPTNKELDY